MTAFSPVTHQEPFIHALLDGVGKLALDAGHFTVTVKIVSTSERLEKVLSRTGVEVKKEEEAMSARKAQIAAALLQVRSRVKLSMKNRKNAY